jgi:hypothetical protein
MSLPTIGILSGSALHEHPLRMADPISEAEAMGSEGGSAWQLDSTKD